MTIKYLIAQAPRLIKLGIGELEGMISPAMELSYLQS
jgi:hypothetical protein